MKANLSITIFIFILSSFICQKHFFYQSNFNRNCDFQTDCQRFSAYTELRLMERLLSITANEVKKKNVQLLKNEQLCVADVMIIAADCTRADNESNSIFLFQLTNNHFSVNCPKPRNLL